jgi:outer membrane protein OmpA-like peptidoglycan-associated protein
VSTAAASALVVCFAAAAAACGAPIAPASHKLAAGAPPADAPATAPVAPPEPLAPPAPPDSDGDAIPDADDKCPDEPETYNGKDDEDGCPDRSIEIIEPPPPHPSAISFARRSLIIRAADDHILNELVQIMASHPEIGRVLVVGHASDDEGSAKKKLALSLRRAEAVVARLIAAGVAAERLVLVGYGDLCRFDGGKTETARQRNRVVDVKMLELRGKSAGVEIACPAAIDAGLVPDGAKPTPQE